MVTPPDPRARRIGRCAGQQASPLFGVVPPLSSTACNARPIY